MRLKLSLVGCMMRQCIRFNNRVRYECNCVVFKYLPDQDLLLQIWNNSRVHGASSLWYNNFNYTEITQGNPVEGSTISQCVNTVWQFSTLII